MKRLKVALNSDAVQALLEELHYPDVRKNAAKKSNRRFKMLMRTKNQYFTKPLS